MILADQLHQLTPLLDVLVLVLDLGEGMSRYDMQRHFEGQSEWKNTIQLYTPICTGQPRRFCVQVYTAEACFMDLHQAWPLNTLC